MKFLLDWDLFNFETGLQTGFDYDYNFYFVFLKNKEKSNKNNDAELVFIGSSTDITASEEILRNMDLLYSILENKEKMVRIALGYFSIEDEKVTDKLISRIEAAMISHFKPKFNGKKIKEYNGPQITISSNFDTDQDWEKLNWVISC
jgi:hypothetical protein